MLRAFFYSVLFFITLTGSAQTIVNENITKYDMLHNSKDKKTKISINKVDYIVVKTPKACGDCFNEINNTIISNAGKKKQVYFVDLIKDNADPVWYIKDNQSRMPNAKKIVFKKYTSSDKIITLFGNAKINVADISPILIMKKEDRLYIYGYKEMFDISGMKSSFVEELKK